MAHGGKQEILTSTGIKLPLIIKNGLPYLVHRYPTQKEMDGITREEFMTSINDWVPTKYDTPEGESQRLIKQFTPIPADVINDYYNDQGDLRVTKGDAVVIPKTRTEIVVETVIDNSEHESMPDPVVVESETGPAVVKSKTGPAVVESKTGPADGTNRYRSKPISKKKKKS